MDVEDLEPPQEKPKPRNLGQMSIEALGEYIAELEAEIARAREAVAVKQQAQSAADGVFKPK